MEMHPELKLSTRFVEASEVQGLSFPSIGHIWEEHSALTESFIAVFQAIKLVQDTMHRFGIKEIEKKPEVMEAYKVAVEAAITSTEALILSIYSDTNMDDNQKKSRMNDAVKSVEKYGAQYGEKLVDKLSGNGCHRRWPCPVLTLAAAGVEPSFDGHTPQHTSVE
eukprot:4011303-Amphidinium_carterae.2